MILIAPLLAASAAGGSVANCSAGTFPADLAGHECMGLSRVPNPPAPGADGCREACCFPECEVWNWCGGGDGGGCHADNGGCYIGRPSQGCRPRAGWVGGSRPAGGQCNASSFQTDISGLQCNGLAKAINW